MASVATVAVSHGFDRFGATCMHSYTESDAVKHVLLCADAADAQTDPLTSQVHAGVGAQTV